MDNSNSYIVFKTIMVYVVFILASPITVFFASKILFEGIFGISNLTSNVWSAIFAVIVLHVAVGMYIYKAYFEADKVKEKPEKVD